MPCGVQLKILMKAASLAHTARSPVHTALRYASIIFIPKFCFRTDLKILSILIVHSSEISINM